MEVRDSMLLSRGYMRGQMLSLENELYSTLNGYHRELS